MKARLSPTWMVIFFFMVWYGSFGRAGQQTPDYGKILGTWRIEVDADGESYHLTLNLKSVEGGLEGTISESMGYFSDVPVSKIVFDGENLSFEFNSPTPPDGMERLVSAEFKVGVDTMDGAVNVPELGVSATASGTREKT